MTLACPSSPPASINIITNINTDKVMQKNACCVSLSLRKRRLTAIIFCLLAAFTLPVPLQAGVPQQQSTYPVKGLVTDAKGVPLPGVTVRYGITGRGDRQRWMFFTPPAGRARQADLFVCGL